MRKFFTFVKTNSLTISILILLLLLTAAIRILVTQKGNFPFWFDVGRDAIISREILEKKDLKIQGPNASGTGDTVFHGVLYYYMIGPLYTLLGGDPRLVLIAMVCFSSLAVVPVFLLTQKLTSKKSIAILASVMYAVSLESIRSGTWLSNPIIATVSLPTFFYLYYLVFFDQQRKLLPWLTLTLAITHQSVILFAPWWGLIGLGFLLEAQKNSLKKWPIKTLILAGLSYLLGVSSMILAQLKVYLAGIFTPNSVIEYASWSGTDVQRILLGTLNLYVNKLTNSLTPTLPLLAVIIMVGIYFFLKSKIETKHQLMLFLMASAPLWLLSWHYRNMYHSFITTEIVVIISLAWLINYLWQNKVTKILAIGLFCLFILSNHQGFKLENAAKKTEYFLPQGAYFSDLLEVVDYSYQQAEGQPFSISTLTNPYGYNTLWSYLYSWYGQKKYGYTPSFYGPEQTGIFGADLMPMTASPSAKHFSIWEPKEGIPDYLHDQFAMEQAKISTPSATKQFGTLRIDSHR